MAGAPAPTVAEALQAAALAGVDRLDAQWLLAEVLQQARTWLLIHDDHVLTADQARAWRDGLSRRAGGEPLAYVLGRKEFFGLELSVDHAVLVPRPDTEVLVEWAIETLQGMASSTPCPEVLDMGTGSGAIALALKQAQPSARLTALDASPEALAVARSNGQRLALDIRWLESHWWSALRAQRFDLIVSNPPYIREGDPHLPALSHEPGMALTSGADGLNALREITHGAPEHLTSGAWLLLEHGHDQSAEVQCLLRHAGFLDISSRRDLAGHLRCTGGRWA